MTYNWNTMVEITVPTGTNGWLYSGEVIINGVKVRFPVGTPTSVPEPAAVLLKKMIELEQEEDANTAKPQNHYVGDVTIPAGKTLTLEKGAKFVDNSGPSEVVILPETEIAAISESPITTAPNAMPVVGAVCTVTYNGTAYDCPAVAAAITAEVTGVAFGNTDALGIPGGNANAPFMVVLLGTPMDVEGVSVYGMLMPMEEFAEGTYVTLSIVEKAETASAGGGVFIVHGTTADMKSVTLDKTPDEAMAAAQAGQHVECHLAFNMGGVVAMTYILTMMYYGEADFGPSVAYGLNMSGSSIEINDGYSGNGSDPAERVTTISMIEA